jgi:hypothetical protein
MRMPMPWTLACFVLLALASGCSEAPRRESARRAFEEVSRGVRDPEHAGIAVERMTDAAVIQFAELCLVYVGHDYARLCVQDIFDSTNALGAEHDIELHFPDRAPGGRERVGALVVIARAHGLDTELEELVAGLTGLEEPAAIFASPPVLRDCALLIADRRAFVRELLPLVRWEPFVYGFPWDVVYEGDTATTTLAEDYAALRVDFRREDGRWKVDGFSREASQ